MEKLAELGNSIACLKMSLLTQQYRTQTQYHSGGY